MDKAREDLERFRQRKKEQAESAAVADAVAKERKAAMEAPMRREPSRPVLASAYSLLDALDPLDALPFRLWRSAHERAPSPTLAVTAAVFVLGQAYFIWLEFGAVFFVLSCFIGICLGLGERKKEKGEASAYSVFNPGCERLLGSMTSEHFERDMLHRQR